MLDSTVVAALRRELEQLEAVREDAAARIAAIELLLGTHPSVPSPPAKSPLPTQTASGHSHGPGDTFRASVRSALESLGGRASAGQIARVLERWGIKPAGSTRMKTLVSSELWRGEKKEGTLRRVDRGVYEILNGENAMRK